MATLHTKQTPITKSGQMYADMDISKNAQLIASLSVMSIRLVTN